MRVEPGRRLLVLVLAPADQRFEPDRHVFERVVRVLELLLHLVIDAVPAGGVRRDHRVVGGHDLGKRAVVADDVLDQPHRLLEQRLAVIVRELVPGLLLGVLVACLAQVELVVPVAGLVEVLVIEDGLVGVPVNALGEEDVVERLAEAVVKGVVPHDRVEQPGSAPWPPLSSASNSASVGRRPASESVTRRSSPRSSSMATSSKNGGASFVAVASARASASADGGGALVRRTNSASTRYPDESGSMARLPPWRSLPIDFSSRRVCPSPDFRRAIWANASRLCRITSSEPASPLRCGSVRTKSLSSASPPALWHSRQVRAPPWARLRSRRTRPGPPRTPPRCRRRLFLPRGRAGSAQCKRRQRAQPRMRSIAGKQRA